MPKISSQDSVEAVKIVLQERISERMCDQIGVDEVHKISCQRKCRGSQKIVPQIGVMEVPKISNQESVGQSKLSLRSEFQR